MAIKQLSMELFFFKSFVLLLGLIVAAFIVKRHLFGWRKRQV
jgi:hypothetical protein